MIEKMEIESNDGFLHLEDLPHNCIFNKVITGCGGTTVVLQNAEDYVIAVPTTELIINKTDITVAGVSKEPYNGIRPFGLFGKFDDAVRMGNYKRQLAAANAYVMRKKGTRMQYFQEQEQRLSRLIILLAVVYPIPGLIAFLVHRYIRPSVLNAKKIQIV